MDFDSVLTVEDHEDGAEMNIINPITNEPTDAFILVMGPDSREFRKAQRLALIKYLRKKESGDDDSYDEDLEQILAVVKGWRGITKDGKELEFNKKECRKLFVNSPMIFDQVNRFVGNRRNFIKG